MELVAVAPQTQVSAVGAEMQVPLLVAVEVVLAALRLVLPPPDAVDMCPVLLLDAALLRSSVDAAVDVDSDWLTTSCSTLCVGEAGGWSPPGAPVCGADRGAPRAPLSTAGRPPPPGPPEATTASTTAMMATATHPQAQRGRRRAIPLTTATAVPPAVHDTHQG